MVKRKIIEIDEDKCTGCGACVTKCTEGALQIVEGKARVVSEVFCDGLGACIGECPEGALEIIERDAPEFDEKAVNRHRAGPGKSPKKQPIGEEHCGCPSHNPMVLTAGEAVARTEGHEKLSPELRNWPVQWKLVNPSMPFFKGKDVLLAADCVPFAFRDFHSQFLSGRPVIIGCPKLDDQQAYLEKLTSIFRDATPKSLTIVHMEVPCCFGLEKLVEEAMRRAGQKIPLKTAVVSVKGEVLHNK